MTRGQFILQTDPAFSHPQMRKLFKLYDEVDNISGLKNKREYIESYVGVVDGHLVLEITAMEGKFFISFMQMIKGNKYIDAFRHVLDEIGLEYRMTGSFPKHLAKHSHPRD